MQEICFTYDVINNLPSIIMKVVEFPNQLIYYISQHPKCICMVSCKLMNINRDLKKIISPFSLFPNHLKAFQTMKKCILNFICISFSLKQFLIIEVPEYLKRHKT